MKKFLALTLALGVSAALAQQPVEITFWSWYLSPKFDAYIKDTISAFEKQNPGIKVKWLDKQDSMVQDFIASVNLGNAPDVVNLNIDETNKAAQNGFLNAVDDLSGKSALTSTFYPNALANFTQNGKVYGYPWYGWLNEGVLLYNPEIFKKAGLTRAPRTMTELMDYARQVKDKTGAYGWVPAYKDPNTASFLGYFYSEGLPVYDKSGKAAFNTAAHAALLQRYVDFYKGGYAPQESLRREAFQVATELYAQGKAAMIIGGPQALNRIKDNNQSLYASTAIVQAPLGKAGVQTGGSMSLVVPKASKHPKEAAKFAAFITNNVNQMAFAKVVAIVPTTRAAQNDAYFKQKSKDPIAIATSLVGAGGRFINPGYAAPKNSDDLYKNFNDNIEAAVLGQKTPQQALNDAVAYWNANMK
ncbi:ABC transporter substrate-binding protein [Deinococcus peraridilitoris]|uniref:ABC-type sugar transport system, periplasmic component n=1 Tax=Deinococcus peraridilitoris (strain DSM 19664 / LMG 22246 / CIP 109416 / KR-200) TaxID=937777 RepID=L0A158_DEIPD|nr:sugar ABC transporter substrate-binding protein [Deinococcus peraridilitoris]AFZ66745.1 ABC-type sugar transport system, periplasmic component [Deinococcus peraridilitoris DSM 19664]